MFFIRYRYWVCTATGIRYIVSSSQNIALSYAGEWLICGSVSLCLFSIGVIQFTITSASHNYDEACEGSSSHINRHSNTRWRLIVQGSVYRFIAGFVILLVPILAVPILPLALILIISIICALQIVIDLRYHPRHRIFEICINYLVLIDMFACFSWFIRASSLIADQRFSS